MTEKLIIPPHRDARYLQLFVLVIYAIVARQLFYLERSHWVLLVCLSGAVGLDVVLGAIYYRKVILPLSACIIGLSSSIIIDARAWYFYLFVVLAAVFSKAFITYRGKHFFNPTNFAVVLALQIFPYDVVSIPTLFSGYLWPSVVFAILGVMTTWYARQVEVAGSWIVGFLFFAVVRSWLKHASLVLSMGPALSSAFLLFSFHMITDPVTTPKDRNERIAFGFLTALFDATFRYLEIPHGIFYSLFLTSVVMMCARREPALAVSNA